MSISLIFTLLYYGRLSDASYGNTDSYRPVLSEKATSKQYAGSGDMQSTEHPSGFSFYPLVQTAIYPRWNPNRLVYFVRTMHIVILCLYCRIRYWKEANKNEIKADLNLCHGCHFAGRVCLFLLSWLSSVKYRKGRGG